MIGRKLTGAIAGLNSLIYDFPEILPPSVREDFHEVAPVPERKSLRSHPHSGIQSSFDVLDLWFHVQLPLHGSSQSVYHFHVNFPFLLLAPTVFLMVWFRHGERNAHERATSKAT